MITNQNENKWIVKVYIRVSTVMQVEDGISSETQTKKIQGYCDYKNLELVKIYEDAGIQDLLANIQKGDNIIVADLSRFGRNTKDDLNMIDVFKTKSVNFICLNPEFDLNPPSGTLILTILSAVNQLERENTGRNVSANMQRISKEGKLRGRAPFGYKFVGKDLDMEPIPEQQEVIKIILQQFA